jgi:hypothetical protein
MEMDFDLGKIPVWELTVFALAALAVVVVVILWIFFGYSLVLVPKTVPTIEAGLSAVLV